MPKISVVVPIYKVEKYLRHCVDSILSQTFTNFELILVDDGSPDDCGKICDEYAKTDKRIVVIHQENGGLSDARNTGIEWALANSDSEWLTFVDSDDWIDKNFLKILLNMVLKNGVDVGVCNFSRISDVTETEIKEEYIAQKWNVEEFFTQKNLNFTVAWGKLYKKSLLSAIRYPKGKIHEDEFVTYKLLFRCPYIMFTEAPLYNYFVNSESIMGTTWTPKHLVALEAFEERLVFFHQNGRKDLYNWQLEHYLFYLCDCCKKLEKNSQYKKYRYPTKKRLRKILKELEKSTHSKLSQEKRWIYDIAYPSERKIYWIIKGIISK